MARYKLYSQSLEIYHQYYSSEVNKVPENKSKINELSAKRNENRWETNKVIQWFITMNHGTYDNDALNTLITEYLSRG